MICGKSSEHLRHLQSNSLRHPLEVIIFFCRYIKTESKGLAKSARKNSARLSFISWATKKITVTALFVWPQHPLQMKPQHNFLSSTLLVTEPPIRGSPYDMTISIPILNDIFKNVTINRKLYKFLLSFTINLLNIFGVMYFQNFGKHSLLLLYHIWESSSRNFLQYYTGFAIDHNIRPAFQFSLHFLQYHTALM